MEMSLILQVLGRNLKYWTNEIVAIHPKVVEMFQSGPKWWTDRATLPFLAVWLKMTKVRSLSLTSF